MSHGWAAGQLASAFTTAVAHQDAGTRRRAAARVMQWERTLQGMADGSVRVGSRTPVRGLPAWVTLEVLRGGFATGRAVAGGPLEPDERAAAEAAGVPASRVALFAWLLTDAGVRHCWDLLDSGRYEVRSPEEAALLTVSWLLRADDVEGAFDVLDELSPLAARLRFLPRAGWTPPAADHVHRRSVADARDRLQTRPLQAQVERQREALAVWNPFTDRVLELWWGEGEGLAAVRFDEAWRVRAEALLAEYRDLTRAHTRCTKHQNPRENLARLLRATRQAMAGPLTDGMRTMVAETVERMVAKRGGPGAASLAALRAQQKAVAQAPRHAELAAVVAARLAEVPQDQGLQTPGQWQGPVSRDEALAHGLPAGVAMPSVVDRVLRPTTSAPVQVLVDQGVVPSAEVLAELLPQLTAVVVAEAFEDPTMATLAGATYRAFRARRSLLLHDLASQVRWGELPWVQAAARHAHREQPDDALAVAREVAGLALGGFPGSLLPNPLVRELDHLFRAGDHPLPFVEELAADIFKGRFGATFTASARAAAPLMAGTVYERYYGLDYAVLDTVAEPAPWWRRSRPHPGSSRVGLAEICTALAGAEHERRSVARNGSIIEWVQVLTTHNVAQLAADGVRPTKPWTQLADEAWVRCCALLDRSRHQRRPLPTIKDAAYAWRQALCFLALAGPGAAQDFLARHDPPAISWPQRHVLRGLSHVAAGGTFDPSGRCPDGARLTGWTTGTHWVLSEPAAAGARSPA